MLYVVQLDWQDKDGVSRLDTILEYALAGTPYKLISHLEEFIALCPDTALRTAPDGKDRQLLFAVNLARGGMNLSYARLLYHLSCHSHCLEGWTGAVLVDGSEELFTKKIGRELIFMANRAGCAFPGKPLVEGTGSLYNFNVQAKLQGIDNLQAYKESARRLVKKVTAFVPRWEGMGQRVLALHASSRRTSNTLLLWELVRQHLPPEMFGPGNFPAQWQRRRYAAAAAMKRACILVKKGTASTAASLSSRFTRLSSSAIRWYSFVRTITMPSVLTLWPSLTALRPCSARTGIPLPISGFLPSSSPATAAEILWRNRSSGP